MTVTSGPPAGVPQRSPTPIPAQPRPRRAEPEQARSSGRNLAITARGRGLGLAGALLLGGGFGLGYPELALLGSAALLALGCASAYTAWRPRLEVHRRAEPDRVTRGEASTVTLTVHNVGRLRAAALVAYDRCGEALVPVPLLRLRPGRDTVVSYPVPTRRRGVVPVGPLSVARADPLGLVVMVRAYGATTRVWVHPRSYPLAAVPAGLTRSPDGRVDRVPHGSITFANLREYVIGDELRHVHWRTSARVGELMVREHLDTSLPRIAVLLDDRATSWSGAAGGTTDGFEAACEAAASVIAAAVREDLAVTLHLVATDDPAAQFRRAHGTAAQSGRAHDPATRDAASREGATGEAATRGAGRAPRLLDRLAEAALVSTADGGALGGATARLRQHRVGDTLVYLTGGGGMADLGLVAALRGAYPTVVVGLLGAATAAPTTVHGVLMLDAADAAEFASAWEGIRSW